VPRQTIEEIAAELREECATYECARRHWIGGLDEKVFWISPRMRCWMFREASASLYQMVREDIVVKKSEVTHKPAVEGAWTFIDIKLSEDELEAGLLNWADANELWDVCVQTMIEGYKFSLTYDSESDSYCCALTGKDCIPENQHKTITAWYDTAVDAMRLVLYKHHMVAAGLWTKAQAAGKRRG